MGSQRVQLRVMVGMTETLGQPSTLETSWWATKVAKALHTFHCFSTHRSSETTWMPTWRERGSTGRGRKGSCQLKAWSLVRLKSHQAGPLELHVTYQVQNARNLELVLTLTLAPQKSLGNSLPSSVSVSSSIEQQWSQLPLRDH